MNLTIIRVVNVFVVALLGGALFGITMGYNPVNLSPGAYLEQQQNAIRSLNVLMPVIGLIGIMLTVIAAVFQYKNKGVFMTLLIAAGLLVISGLVTKFGNQPINAIVITWTKNDIAGNWIELRDKWWLLHIIRTACSVIALFLIIVASVGKGK
jgi:anthrone oxygenase-like protein